MRFAKPQAALPAQLPFSNPDTSAGSLIVEWIERIVDYGTPLIVLVLVLRMLAKCAHWTAKHFALPLRDAWVNHLAVLDKHMEKQTRLLCEILERVQEC